MPFYRYGDPGKDSWAHLHIRKNPPAQCRAPRMPEDDPKIGEICGRMSVALCDAVIGFGSVPPTCDIPVCEFHRTQHATKKNTDYCPDHKEQANGI